MSLGTVWDRLGPFWTILDNVGPFWTILAISDQMVQNGQNGPKWSKVVQDGPKWSKVDLNGPKQSQTVPTDHFWSKII